jgi:PadR family transcriptional regulator PadR
MRMTLATTLVMQAIGAGHGHGFDIVEVTGYATGTVYPALRRLERDGYVRSHWESERLATREGRPARRYYELTAAGVKALDAALHTLRQLDAASRLRPGTAE